MTPQFYDLKSDIDAGKLIRIVTRLQETDLIYSVEAREMGEGAWRACGKLRCF